MTCVGGTLGPDLLVHLRAERDLVDWLVGVDACETAAGRPYVDSFFQVPWADAPDYVENIARIVKQQRVNVVLPGSDQEAFVLSRAREELLAAGAALMTSPPAVLELIKDKEATYRTAESAGIVVPQRRIVTSFAELKFALTEFGYPEQSVVCKPTAGRGGRGLRILVGTGDPLPAWMGGGARESRYEVRPSDSDMDAWFADGSLMVMPALRAPAYDVDVFAVSGKAKHAFVRERVNPAGIPFAGNILRPEVEIREYCISLAGAFGLDGLHDIDLMTDREGRPALLEVNPRMSGSAVASHAAGFPVVAAAVAAGVGLDYEIAPVTERIEVTLIPRATITRAMRGK